MIKTYQEAPKNEQKKKIINLNLLIIILFYDSFLIFLIAFNQTYLSKIINLLQCFHSCRFLLIVFASRLSLSPGTSQLLDSRKILN